MHLIVGSALLLLAGCVPSYTLYQRPAAELNELRSEIGTVGVVIDPALPELVDVRPASGPWEGFKRGFAVGAGAPIVMGTLAPIPGSALFGYLVAVITGPAGGIYGMFNYLPAEEVDRVTQMLQSTAGPIRDLALRQSFTRELVRLGRLRTDRRFIEISADVPPAQADTVLKVKAVRAGLKGLYQIDPPSSAFLEIEAHLLRVSDGTELITANVSCYSDRRTYIGWGTDAGQGFIDTLVRCVPLLAEKLIDDVFLVVPTQGG